MVMLLICGDITYCMMMSLTLLCRLLCGDITYFVVTSHLVVVFCGNSTYCMVMLLTLWWFADCVMIPRTFLCH